MRAEPVGLQADVFIADRIHDHTLMNDEVSFIVHKDDKKADVVLCCNLAHYNPRGNLLVAVTDDEYMALFLSRPGGVHCISSITHLQLERIGYLSDQDLSVADTILKMFEIKFAGEYVKLDKIEFTSTPCVFVMANVKNIPKELLNMVSVYTYNNLNPNMHKRAFPYANVKQLDTKVLIPGYVGPDEVMTVLSFNNVLYTANTDKTQSIDICARYFVDNMPILHKLSDHFRLHQRAILYMKIWKDDMQLDRSLRPILEQFSFQNGQENGTPFSDVVTIVAGENVAGYLDMPKRNFELDGGIVNGTPVVIGDIVVLTNQNESAENGEYIVVGLREDGGTTMEPKDITNGKGTEAIEDETFFCVTSPQFIYKHECLDPNHPLSGEPKMFMDVWDAPCKFSSQCPFFKWDERQGEYVGRCVDGLCEMPPGYTRVGFRKYINQGQDE
jgi:hypothetical protein